MKVEEDVNYNSNGEVTALVPMRTSFDRSKIVLVLEKIVKRFVDIIGGLVGLIMLIPLSIIIWVANFISEDRGPLFFTQERIGKDGKNFKMYKYRSMVVGADEKLKKYLEENEEARKEYKEYKKLKNDPRVTKIGNFIRKTSIDEFPQFINVLKGEMSLVGPRPVVKEELKKYGKNIDKLLSVTPGMTGFWQVNGHNNLTYNQRIKLDMFYIDNISFKLDVLIIMKTFTLFFKRKSEKI